MNDYLWDGTGEPDADVEQLETALRPLRYAPPAKPFTLPNVDAPRRNGNGSVLRWALAAAVAFAALALGIWLIRQPSAAPLLVASAGSAEQTDLNWPSTATVPESPGVDGNTAVSTSRVRSDGARIRQQQIAARARAEQREGRLAAEQLLKALQITSDQLNYVRTRASQTGELTPAS
jgi:hypothetical protein